MKGHEAVIIRADGAQIPVEVASVRTSWGGKPAFQVIMRDMSERKLAEEAARARLALERRYAAAVAALEEGVVVMDRSGTVRAANESAVRMLGRRLHEAQGDAIFTGSDVARHDPAGTFTPDELPIAAALERNEVTTNVVLGVHDDEGRDQWLSVSARPWRTRTTTRLPSSARCPTSRSASSSWTGWPGRRVTTLSPASRTARASLPLPSVHTTFVTAPVRHSLCSASISTGSSS